MCLHFWRFTVQLENLSSLFVFFVRVSSRLCCWSSSGFTSWETTRPPWRLPDCRSPSRDTAPCPGPSHPQPRLPLFRSVSRPRILLSNLDSPQVGNTVLYLCCPVAHSFYCTAVFSWSMSLPSSGLAPFEKFLASNFTSSLQHSGLEREISIQKAGELAQKQLNSSALHLIAVIIELDE